MTRNDAGKDESVCVEIFAVKIKEFSTFEGF
jgi:hypothetical protein